MNQRHRRFLHAVLALALTLSAPATASPEMPCAAGAAPMARLELLFGGSVSTAAWGRFIAHEVTPRFPEGLTTFEGNGQWRSPKGVVAREKSRLLLIWYRPDTASDVRIEAIRAAYKQRFRQQSVMRVDGTSCVSF